MEEPDGTQRRSGWLRGHTHTILFEAELHVFPLSFRFFFRSGNIEHPGDKLFNTSVEVLPFDVSLGQGEEVPEVRTMIQV